MGRTVPTFRQLIDDAIARWAKFRRALRREDQEYFDRLFRRVRTYTQAATYQASDNPMEAILLSIALDQEKRLDALEHATPRQVADALRSAGTAPLQVRAALSPETGASFILSQPEENSVQLDALKPLALQQQSDEQIYEFEGNTAEQDH